MYLLGDDWYELYKLCKERLDNNPDSELLKDVMQALNEFSRKRSMDYKIVTSTISAPHLKISNVK